MSDSNKPAHGGYPDAVALCACKDRPAAECQEQWGPNCDLGNNLKHARVFQEPTPVAVPAEQSLHDVLRELVELHRASYVLSPEGRSYLKRLDAALALPQAAPVAVSFQDRVQPWLLTCFGAEIASDQVERNHRFLEESLELVQACGCTQSEAHQLVDYVFGRPVGDKPQEVGGVMVTLAALCLAQSLDMHAAGDTELTRIWTMVGKIRAKQAAKPKHSPLPEYNPPAPGVPTPLPETFVPVWIPEAGRYVNLTWYIKGVLQDRDEEWLASTQAVGEVGE